MHPTPQGSLPLPRSCHLLWQGRPRTGGRHRRNARVSAASCGHAAAPLQQRHPPSWSLAMGQQSSKPGTSEAQHPAWLLSSAAPCARRTCSYLAGEKALTDVSLLLPEGEKDPGALCTLCLLARALHAVVNCAVPPRTRDPRERAMTPCSAWLASGLPYKAALHGCMQALQHWAGTSPRCSTLPSPDSTASRARATPPPAASFRRVRRHSQAPALLAPASRCSVL